MTQKVSGSLEGWNTKQISLYPDSSDLDTFFCILEAGAAIHQNLTTFQSDNQDSLVFGAVISGCGEICINHKLYPIAGGTCFFYDCSQPVSWISSSTEPWEVLWIHFAGSSSLQYFRYFSKRFSNTFKPSSFNKITAVLQDILVCNEVFSETNIIVTSKLIVKLLTIAMTTPYEFVVNQGTLRHKLSSVHNFIEEHFSDDLSLEAIASQFYISKFYLAREYKKIYGKTIFQHIISLRISHGKQLLRFSDKSVDEIAQICGFNDQSYFTKQFRKLENMTCFEYRKKWRG